MTNILLIITISTIINAGVIALMINRMSAVQKAIKLYTELFANHFEYELEKVHDDLITINLDVKSLKKDVKVIKDDIKDMKKPADKKVSKKTTKKVTETKKETVSKPSTTK